MAVLDLDPHGLRRLVLVAITIVVILSISVIISMSIIISSIIVVHIISVIISWHDCLCRRELVGVLQKRERALGILDGGLGTVIALYVCVLYVSEVQK